MPYYIVFTGIPSGGYMEKHLYWGGPDNPVGVFQAVDSDDACKAAAQKSGRFGTFFAVEGTPWGVDMLNTEGTFELGNELQEKEAKLEDAEKRLRALEAQNEEKYRTTTGQLDDLEGQ